MMVKGPFDFFLLANSNRNHYYTFLNTCLSPCIAKLSGLRLISMVILYYIWGQLYIKQECIELIKREFKDVLLNVVFMVFPKIVRGKY